jgi:hypothetical protein
MIPCCCKGFWRDVEALKESAGSKKSKLPFVKPYHINHALSIGQFTCVNCDTRFRRLTPFFSNSICCLGGIYHLEDASRKRSCPGLPTTGIRHPTLPAGTVPLLSCLQSSSSYRIAQEKVTDASSRLEFGQAHILISWVVIPASIPIMIYILYKGFIHSSLDKKPEPLNPDPNSLRQRLAMTMDDKEEDATCPLGYVFLFLSKSLPPPRCLRLS